VRMPSFPAKPARKGGHLTDTANLPQWPLTQGHLTCQPERGRDCRKAGVRSHPHFVPVPQYQELLVESSKRRGKNLDLDERPLRVPAREFADTWAKRKQDSHDQ
jgi:hypothetical protein